MVGSGGVVVRDLPADVVAVGNPARIVRRLDREAPGRPDTEASGLAPGAGRP